MTRPSLIRARPWAGPSRSGKWYRAERRRRRGRNAPRERSRRSRWWRSVSAEAGPIRPRDGSSLADSSPRRASRQLPPAGSIESPPSGISQPSQSKAATSRASTGAPKSGKYRGPGVVAGPEVRLAGADRVPGRGTLLGDLEHPVRGRGPPAMPAVRVSGGDLLGGDKHSPKSARRTARATALCWRTARTADRRSGCPSERPLAVMRIPRRTLGCSGGAIAPSAATGC